MRSAAKPALTAVVLVLLAALGVVSLFALGRGRQAESVVGSKERVRIISSIGEIEVIAKIDTGADRSSIDSALARDLGLDTRARKTVVISEEGAEERLVADVTYVLDGRRITSSASLADRSRLSTPMLVGRSDLEGFLVDPSHEFLTRPARNAPGGG